MAASGHEHDEDESDAEHAYEDPEIPPLPPSASASEKLLNPNLAYEYSGKKANQEEDPAEGLGSAGKLKKVLQRKLKENEYQRSIALGINLWQTPKSESPADERDKPGHMFAESFEDHIAALRNKDH